MTDTFNVNDYPKRLQVRKTIRGIEVVHKTKGKGLGSWLITAFAVGWNAIVAVFLYAMMTGGSYEFLGEERSGFGWGPFLFLIPFILVGSVVIWATFVAWFGVTRLTVNPGKAEIFDGLWFLGWTERFQLNANLEIDNLAKLNRDSQWDRQITLKRPGKKDYQFGIDMDDESRAYIVALLRNNTMS